MRIISICPSNTELLAYLGLTNQIVAVDDFSNWPDEIVNLPRLGPDLNIDMDQLEALSPDLVIASLSVPGMERNIEQLQLRHIPHIVLNPNSIEEILEDLLKVGKETNTLDKAEMVVAQFKKELADFKEIHNGKDRGSFYWEWWPKPIFTPGKQNWLTDVSEIVGGRNCFADIERSSVQTDWEDVVRRNPDHICMVWVGVKEDKMKLSAIVNRESASEITAVQKKQLYILEESLFCRPSPRIFEGIKKLTTILAANEM